MTHKKRVGFEEAKAETPVEREARLDAIRKANLALGKGRPPGTPNRVTKTIREAVLEAVQPGACHEEGLAGWLKDRALGGIEDRKIFAGVVSRVIPVEITGTGGGPIKIDLGWMTDRRLVTGEVVDVTPRTRDMPAVGHTSTESIPYEGGAPDVRSEDGTDKESEA